MDEVCLQSLGEEGNRPLLILFLHGSGDTGPGFRTSLESFSSINEITAKHAITLFPTAPKRPYTLLRGKESHVWFDRPGLCYEAVEDRETLQDSVATLNNLIASSAQAVKGRPIVVLVGFSMGGAMALHLAMHRMRQGLTTHGVVVLSSFIGGRSAVIPRLTDIPREMVGGNHVIPALKMIHGTADEVIPVNWGRDTAAKLHENGFTVVFSELQGIRHELSHAAIQEVRTFVSTIARKVS